MIENAMSRVLLLVVMAAEAVGESAACQPGGDGAWDVWLGMDHGSGSGARAPSARRLVRGVMADPERDPGADESSVNPGWSLRARSMTWRDASSSAAHVRSSSEGK